MSHRGMNYMLLLRWLSKSGVQVCHIPYRREAFALLVSIDWAMREPYIVKRATSVGFTLFVYVYM